MIFYKQDADFAEERGLDALHADTYPTDQRLKCKQKLKDDKLAGQGS